MNRKQYASYANNTRWTELWAAMVKIGPARAPKFDAKRLGYPYEEHWDGEWFHHFRCDFDWEDMEWVILKPRDTENSIQSDEIARICKNIGFEVEREGDIVKLIGYRPMS